MGPRRGKDSDPKMLLDVFHAHPVAQTRMELIRARLEILDSDETALRRKADRFKGAAILLGIAGLLFVTHTATGLHSPRPASEGRSRPAVISTREPATVSVRPDSMIPSPTGDPDANGDARPSVRPGGSSPMPAARGDKPPAPPTTPTAPSSVPVHPGLITTVTKSKDPSGMETK